MRRREFILALGGAAAWPLAAHAQEPGKRPTIGFLGTDASAWSPWTAAFVQRLRELGWIEGYTIAIEYRWAEGRSEREGEIATEFVHMKVDIIVTTGSAAVRAKQATAVIPIIFPIQNDPVGSGLIASLARPGGNVTGLSFQGTDLAGKRLALLREVVPGLRQLVVMFDAGYPPAVLEMRNVEVAAPRLDFEVVPLEIHRSEDIARHFETLKPQAEALYVAGGSLVSANRTRIVTLALAARQPTTFNERSFVQIGGLMSYGPNFQDLFRRAAELVDKILRGTKPGEIPVEQPTKFELVINMKTAKVLGITVPETVLARADEVIE